MPKLSDDEYRAEILESAEYGPWIECWSCGGEGYHEDCFEDCCVCLNPPCRRVTCEECRGAGGWSEDDASPPDTQPIKSGDAA